MLVWIAPGVVSADIDGARVVMNDSLEFYELDSMGSAIWNLLEQNPATDAIAAHVAALYALEVETVAADVERFVACLVSDGLVVLDESQPSVT